MSAKKDRGKIKPGHPFYDLIDEAYRVFKYPTPQTTGVCDCCMYPEIEKDFFNPPIRDLPFHYLRDWYFAACNPGSLQKSVWAYLLPRVLEALAAGGEDPASVGLEVTLYRYPTGDRGNWSDAEWSVLDRFQRAYLDRAMREGEEYLDDTLCMFGLGGWPLDDLFEQVNAFPDEVIVERFWHDWCKHCRPGRESIWITAFWESPGNSEAFSFYTSKALYNRVETFALDDTTPPELSEKAAAVGSVILSNADWVQSE